MLHKKDLLGVVDTFGTPVYGYDESTIQRQCALLSESLPNASFYYSCKTNNNPALLEIIRTAKMGAEAVSVEELQHLQSVGFKKQDISFTCSNLTEKELKYAARASGCIHLDSLHQIMLWGKNQLGTRISLRINQGIGAGHHRNVITGGDGSKFGITLADLPEAKKIADQYNLTVSSLHQHIGSNILDESIMLGAIEMLLETAREFPDVTDLNFGGGFGVPYQPKENPFDVKKFSKAFVKLITSFETQEKRTINVSFEPGRFLVAQAGVLLVHVVDIKETNEHTFVGVNSGFNHLLRPVLYDTYHHIENLSRPRARRGSVTVTGNICESGDIFAKNRTIPMPHIGDVLAFYDAGAYGMSMASKYNMRTLPNEVLITSSGDVKDISVS